MDEVRIWNISRTKSEITDAILRTLNETEAQNPNLIGYWRFDEGEGIITQDYSSYGNDAVLGSDPNTPSWSY